MISFHIRWITNSFPGIKKDSSVEDNEHETGDEEEVDHVEAEGEMIGQHHQMSTIPTPPIKPTTTTIKKF